MASTWARTTDGDMFFKRRSQPAPSLVTALDDVLRIQIPDRVGLLLGEWAFNTADGFPWQLYVGSKNPNTEAIRRSLSQYIADTAGVGSVADASATFDKARRALGYAYEVVDDEGNTVEGTGAPLAPTSADDTSSLGLSLSRLGGGALIVGVPA